VARTRTLTQILTDLRWQSDQLGATLRHDDTSLTRAVNQSIQRWREWVSEQGSPLYLTAYSSTLTVGPTSPYAFGTINVSALSPVCLHVYLMEVTVNGQVLDVPQLPFEARNQYQGVFGPTPTGSTQSIPVGFFRYGTTLGIVPPPQSAYPFTLWYMGLLPDLVNPTDTFDGIAGWEEWLNWDVLIKILVRDRDLQAYQTATAERDRLQADFEQRLRQDRPSVSKRYDLRGMRNRRTML
jgi:hypothetical protein